jgi:hypothetical protein
MKTKYKNLEKFYIYFISSHGNSQKSFHFQKNIFYFIFWWNFVNEIKLTKVGDLG